MRITAVIVAMVAGIFLIAYQGEAATYPNADTQACRTGKPVSGLNQKSFYDQMQIWNPCWK